MPEVQNSYVLKIDVNSDQDRITSVGQFPGRTIGQWAYKEVGNFLAVASTTFRSVVFNHLFIFEKQKIINQK